MIEIGNHIIIKPINYGQRIIVSCDNNLIHRYIKYNKELVNELDHLLNKNLSKINTLYVYSYPNLDFGIKVDKENIFLEKVYTENDIISNRSNLKVYANKLKLDIEPILFEGKVTKENIDNIIKIADKDDIIIINNKIIKKNKTIHKSKDYNQLLITEIIDFFVDKKILIFKQGENYWLNYIELITEMFCVFTHYNNNSLLQDDFGYELNNDYIPEKYKDYILSNQKNINLYKLFLTLFYTEKKNWNGFFYSDYYTNKLQLLKEQIHLKIKFSTLNLPTFLN